MHRSLGAKIGEGATAEVYDWAPGRVIKLFKPGVPHRIRTHEVRTTRAVQAATDLAPEVFEEIDIEGRSGFVMARLDGLALGDATKSKAVSYAMAGIILAGCLRTVHTTLKPPEIPSLRDYLANSIGRARDALPRAVEAGILALVDRRGEAAGLCHGDPNPGNVIMTTRGPRLIDWISAMRAPAAFDLASAQVILTELAPHFADEPERPLAVNAALQVAYAGLIDMSPAAMAASVRPYLPVVRALVLMGGAVPTQSARLIRSLELDFPS